MKTKDTYYYPAVFTYEPGQQIAVVFPDFDVATCGEDDIEAFDSARELLGITIWGMEEDGEALPPPSRLSNIETKDNEKAILVDVFMPTIRMAGINKSVNRTVTLPAWLNALALEKGVNFSAVLQDGLKEHLGVF